MHNYLKALWEISSFAIIIGLSTGANAQIQTYQGTPGQDIFPGFQAGGYDYNGEGDYDQIDYSGASSDYTFNTQSNGTIHVIKTDGSNDILSSIEGAWFTGEAKWYSIADLTNNNTSSSVTHQGTSGDDIFNGLITGQADFYGREGYDQINYPGASTDFNFTLQANGEIHAIKIGQDGRYDLLDSVEGIYFSGEAQFYDLNSLLTGSSPDNDTPKLKVTAVNILSSNGNQHEISLTVENETQTNFSQLHTVAYSLTPSIIVQSNDIDVGTLNALTDVTTTDTFTVSAPSIASVTLEHFDFSFDDRSTLEGIDLDANGLRDDLDMIIEKNTQTSNQKTLFEGFAKSANTMNLSTTGLLAANALQDVEKYIGCLMREYEGSSQSITGLINSYLVAIANTDDRIQARFSAMALAINERPEPILPLDSELDIFCQAAISNN